MAIETGRRISEVFRQDREVLRQQGRVAGTLLMVQEALQAQGSMIWINQRHHEGAHLRNRPLLVTLVTIGLAGSFSAQAQDHDIVWVWNPHCRTPIHVALRLRLDAKTVYVTSLPLCRWERRFAGGKTSFQFTPGRPLIWYGYRSDEGVGTKDPGDPTAAGATLTIDLWQAGGESDVIELGYSVAANDGLHMNSIHLLSPTAVSTTTMAPGLILETGPETKR